MRAIPEIRVRSVNEERVAESGDYVLYWMTAQRRARWNFGLQHAASRAVELNPSKAEALRYLSLYYSHTGDNAAAIAAIERVRELQPESSSTYYYASKIYLNAGEIDRAYAELDEALAKGYSRDLAAADPDLAPLMKPRITKT